MMKRILFAAALLVALAGTSQAQSCSWTVAPATLNFGNYSIAGTVTGTTSFQITCARRTTGRVTLTRGAWTPTYNPRQMKHLWTFTTIPYNLYMDAANSSIWGDGTSGTSTYTAVNSTSGTQTYSATIYGALPPGADPIGGGYGDIVTATLTWGTSASETRSFTIIANATNECTVSTFALNFGNYDPVEANATAPLDSSALINVYCTRGTTGTVTLDLGSWSSGTARRMRGASGEFLSYQIYRDPARSTIWNTVNTNSGSATAATTALAGGFTAYGRIFAGQDVSVGGYSDTIQATVNY